MKTKVLILDDHRIFLEGIVSIFDSEIYDVVPATSVDQALLFLKASIFDLLITDIHLPEKDGGSLVQKLFEDKNPVKVIVLTFSSNLRLFNKLMEFKINAYLKKNTSRVEFMNVVRIVNNNGTYFQDDIYSKYLENREFLKGNGVLTNREVEVLNLIAQEKTTKEISNELNISKYTVSDHRKNLLRKTGVSNIVGLIKYALENNLIA